MAFAMSVGSDRRFLKLAPAVLYETIGPLVPDPAVGAMWALSQQVAMSVPRSVRRAGVGEGVPDMLLGNALFRALLGNPSGLVFTVDEYDATMARLETPDGRVNLVVDELVDELRSLADLSDLVDDGFPFVLAAGERRTNTANTLFRDPDWRKHAGSLRISPTDAAALGLSDGMAARVTTRSGSLTAPVEVTETLRPGHASLPNGHGLAYPGTDGESAVDGPPVNLLTSTEERDPIAGTPWHKHVRARIEPAAN